MAQRNVTVQSPIDWNKKFILKVNIRTLKNKLVDLQKKKIDNNNVPPLHISGENSYHYRTVFIVSFSFIITTYRQLHHQHLQTTATRLAAQQSYITTSTTALQHVIDLKTFHITYRFPLLYRRLFLDSIQGKFVTCAPWLVLVSVHLLLLWYKIAERRGV